MLIRNNSEEGPIIDDTAVRTLYERILAGWNQRSAQAMAEPFATAAELIGFDGSQVCGRAEILAHLAPIFAHHPTPAYVAKVKSVRFPAPDVAILRAHAGMVPDGKSDIEPSLNTVHTMVATKSGGVWGAELFQSTPAQYHGRPELVEAMTAELRELLR